MPVCRSSGTSNKQAAERGNMILRRLNEEIILQALLDLSHHACKEEVMHFFSGERFRICADMAGMDSDGSIEVLEIARLLARNFNNPNQRNWKTKRVNTTTGMIPGGASMKYMNRQEALS